MLPYIYVCQLVSIFLCYCTFMNVSISGMHDFQADTLIILYMYVYTYVYILVHVCTFVYIVRMYISVHGKCTFRYIACMYISIYIYSVCTFLYIVCIVFLYIFLHIVCNPCCSVPSGYGCIHMSML